MKSNCYKIGSITALAVSRECKLIVTGGEDMSVKLWSYDNLSQVNEWSSLYNSK